MNNRPLDSGHKVSDEISLVDLAVIFVRRRRIFYAVMLVCTLAGVAYALIADSTYRYTSLIQGAMVASDQPLTAPPALIATLKARWLPETKARYESENGQLPFDVAFENPEDTSLVQISTEAGGNQADLVNRIHSALVDQVVEDQSAGLDERRSQLESQIESMSDLIVSLKRDGVTRDALASAVDRKANLQIELSSLQSAKKMVVARQSSETTGPRRVLIIALSVVLGMILGVFAVFFTEFLVAVRAQVAQKG